MEVAMPKVCSNCGKEFPFRVVIEGKERNLKSRKYCLECSPFNSRNTIRIHLKGEIPERWKDKEKLEEIVSRSTTFSQILRALDLKVRPGNYRTLKKYLQIHGIDLSHMKGQKHGFTKIKVPDEEVFCKDSLFSHSGLRRRLIKDQIIPYECGVCGLSKWRGESLTLQVDHINGDCWDHRVPNLRFLCPNCHSQTDSYRGRNKKRNQTPKELYQCPKCETEVSKKGNLCPPCGNRSRQKIDWPSSEELRVRTAESSFSAVARELGVSDNAIRKRLRDHPNE
ncbi:MAG: hypothetical protein GF334_07490 [Candidatus Altiarchaeales archaeon]|nr:hypothetical protein [Candidatus Altiarchaeales archaeon]